MTGYAEVMRWRVLVRKEGFEPPRPFGHKILSLARLPVPPLPHGAPILSIADAAFHQDLRGKGVATGKGRLAIACMSVV
jgi:hypothetical protein